MKKLTFSLLATSLILVACGEKPLTEAEQAAQYGMTVERFREEKQAAARMNMSFDEHIKMLKDDGSMGGMNHGNM